MFEKLGSALAANQNLACHTQFGDLVIVVEVTGAALWTIALSNGAITLTKGATGAETFRLKATQESWERLFAAVPPVGFEIMKGLGHFPMSENPAQFLQYLRPVLGKIHAAA